MEDYEPPFKRFKYQSYNASLRNVHLPSALEQSNFNHDIADHDSHFREALDHWRQLNLAPHFLRFVSEVDSLAESMPSLLHNWSKILDLWFIALDGSDDEALTPLLDLLSKLVHDLRKTLMVIYPDLLKRLLSLLSRPLAAPSLKTLLASFSALFKHLLVPAPDQETLDLTWTSVRVTLLRCIPEVQKAMAEVWGLTLRLLKPPAREYCVLAMVESIEGIDDSCAWMLVFACKSVSQTLHKVTGSLLSHVLDYHLSCESPKATGVLIRRLLTALAHHCKRAELFSVIGDHIVEELTSTLSSHGHDGSGHERLRRILEVASIVSALRGGGVLSQRQLTLLTSHHTSLPIVSPLHNALLNFATSTLTEDVPHWLVPGRELIKRSRLCPRFAIKLYGALAELDWGGWKMIALPAMLSATPQMLETEPRAMLRLLSTLNQRKMLGEVDVVWKSQVEDWLRGRFTSWIESGENIADELNDVLALSSVLPSSFSILLVKMVEAMLDSKADEKQDPWRGWVLGSCMLGLAERNADEWVGHIDIVSLTCRCTENWACLEIVLRGLVALLHSSPPQHQNLIQLDVVFDTLKAGLLSHSQAVRMTTLRVLSDRIIKSSSAQQDILRACLQGESVALDVQGARERILRVRQVGQALRDNDEIAANICVRWLVAQFKVNLRPIWTPAAETLALVSERFGAVVWRTMFEELKGAVCSSKLAVRPGQGQVEVSPPDDATVPTEDERSWRDPASHRWRCVVAKWLVDGPTQVISSQAQHERFDPVSYELQLLSAVAECSSLAERHNRDLVPLFLSLPIGWPNAENISRRQLGAWLTVFSKFTNPKALHSAETLRQLYINHLSHPDKDVQSLALSCLLTFKSPHLIPHQEQLRNLLDETRWRDELTALNLNDMEDNHRSEAVNILIRLCFGLMLKKSRRSRGGNRRAAVLNALSGCTDHELGLLVALMLQWQKGYDDSAIFQAPQERMPWRQQVGFLTLLGDVLRILGPRLLSHWHALLDTTIKLVGQAQLCIDSAKNDGTPEQRRMDIDEEEVPVGDDVEISHNETPLHSARLVRQIGTKRLTEFFHCPVLFDYKPYVEEAFKTFISPRLAAIEAENTQAPAALLALFMAWASQATYVRYLVEFDSRVIPTIYACLVAPNVQATVTTRILDIVERLLSHAAEDASISELVIKPHVSLLLKNLAALLGQRKGSANLSLQAQRQIDILSELAQYLTDTNQASTFLFMFSTLLRQPARLVPEKSKVQMLKIIHNLIPLLPDLHDCNSLVYTKLYSMLANLLGRLHTRPARRYLVNIFQCLSTFHTSLRPLADLLDSLNAYSVKRLEEPDFDRRLEAFGTLNDTLSTSFSAQQWLPLLHSMLFFLRDPTELALRTNAALALRIFIDIMTSAPSSEYETIFIRELFPGLKAALHSKEELVRAEVLGVIGHAVLKCDRLAPLQEMRILLADGDEEANFFNNFHHVQIHRRARAIRRLADQCDDGRFRSQTLAGVLLPLVSNYIVPASVDHVLVNEAITATGKMAKHLSWGAYHGLVRKYMQASRAKDMFERYYVRVLVAILQSFHFQMEDTVEARHAVEGEEADEEQDIVEGPFEDIRSPAVKATEKAVIADVVNLRLLPSLMRHLEKRDEIDDSIRIPISLGIVEVAKHLPDAVREAQINRLLTVLSQVLRSRSQETRDLLKDTICRIAATLGPLYLSLIIKEMRQALVRGPQLHVLAYVVHALLTHVTDPEHVDKFDALGDCVNDMAEISAEVIFGESGKDVEAEGFRTTFREVRASASKAIDTFAIAAKYVIPAKIKALLVPLRAIMHETESAKVLERVDEILRRIASGLVANKHLGPTDLLALCNALIGQDAQFFKQAQVMRERQPRGRADVIVQVKRQTPTKTNHYTSNSHRFVTFGLELLHTSLKRNRFDFKDPSIRSRMDLMVAVIGNAFYHEATLVLIATLKIVAIIVKCPLNSLAKSVPVFVRQLIDIVKQTGSTSSDLVQAAFKSLAAILRDYHKAEVKEEDLLYLVELLSSDLEEPNRQAAAFTLLRAIVSRKFVIPEIYDLMDKVSEILVTNQATHVQELCRLTLLQFLLDYPQGKGRLRNQMIFLLKNLSYAYESGRKSVLELLGAIIAKFNDDLIREYADLIFVPLVMALANDDSVKCREMAAALIKALFARLHDDHRSLIVSLLNSWSTPASQPQLAAISAQVYGLIVDLLQQDAIAYVVALEENVNAIVARSAQAFIALKGAEQMDIDLIWQAPYHALITLYKVLRVFPGHTTQQGKIGWPDVIAHLLFPHAWVRTASCRLLGLLFTAAPPSRPSPLLPAESPLSQPGLRDIAENLCSQLTSEHLDNGLSLQVVKNLFYVGKCFYLVPTVDESDPATEHDADDQKKDHPLPWLFSKVSYQVRSAHIARRNRAGTASNWSEQPSAILRWFAAMATHMDPARLETFLTHILVPIYWLTEDDTIHDSQMAELKTLAIELRDLVQSRVGTIKFATTYNQIRQSVLRVQRERKDARVKQATKNPQAAARRKIHRNALKKASGKLKKTGIVRNSAGRLRTLGA